MYDDLKFNLCCGARMLFRAGLSAGIAGHLSIKVGPNTMIANRFGPSFGTVTPADVLTLDLDGNIQEPPRSQTPPGSQTPVWERGGISTSRLFPFFPC